MDKTKIRVLIIDPWCLTYIQEMASEMSKVADVTLATKYGAKGISQKVAIRNVFFKISDALNRNLIRKIIRWIEYVQAWIKIHHLVNKEKFNIIHVQWLLHYPTDIFFLKKISKCAKKHSIKLIYTAHNALPHINGEKSKKSMGQIYKLFDTVIVHGNDTKKEIQTYFPNVKAEYYIQKHGAILTTKNNIEVDKDLMADNLYRRVAKCKGKKILLLGNIFHNKGFDRIMKYWCDREKELQGNILIVAGSLKEADQEYRDLEKKAETIDSIIYYPQFVSNAEHDFLFSTCDVVALPYRHASMSGVIFSAAQFCKTVLTTNAGCIPEYIIDGENAFLVDNNDESINKGLDEIIFNTSKERLVEMGDKLNIHISTTCSWKLICDNLVKDVYSSKMG
jgi:glycosyltransferase involved in cell wall biosynthesis